MPLGCFSASEGVLGLALPCAFYVFGGTYRIHPYPQLSYDGTSCHARITRE